MKSWLQHFLAIPPVKGSTYRDFDTVRIAKDREIGFAYSLDEDCYGIVEYREVSKGLIANVIPIRRSSEQVDAMLLRFASGDLGDISLHLKTDDKRFDVYEAVNIGSGRSLGTGFSCDTGEYALFDIFAPDARTLQIEEAYDNEVLENAIVRFVYGDYEIIVKAIEEYNVKLSGDAEISRERSGGKHVRGSAIQPGSTGLPTQRDFD